jgi:ABC-type multidrug transport system ATPase subunit
MRCDKLELSAGQSVAIVGDNGSGKSTLLRVLAGVTQLTEGKFETFPSWSRSAIVYMPQSGGLYGNLTVRENASIHRRLYGYDNSSGIAAKMWSSAALEKHADVAIFKLSGGYQKLMALYIAFSTKAEILILDEPSGELNAAHQTLVSDLLRMAREHYRSIIFSDHSSTMIEAADRLFEMHQP